MLNVGFSELLVFAIIALLVLGPEKLPEGARFVGKWYGKVKRFIGKVQNEIDQELKLSEFRAEMQQEIDRLTELEVRMHKQIEALKGQKLVDINDDSKKHKSLDQVSFQHLTQTVTPYSNQFIQSNLSVLPQSQKISQAPTLRIAV